MLAEQSLVVRGGQRPHPHGLPNNSHAAARQGRPRLWLFDLPRAAQRAVDCSRVAEQQWRVAVPLG
jgi:hypothetical protein